MTDYNCTGNTILTDIEFTDNSRVYFLTTYRNVAAWYSNNLRFTKKNTGKFHEEKGEILALTPFVDAVIADGRCYIINESNFNKIFKFDAVIKKQVEEHADEIKQLGFIDNGGDFYNYISKSSRSKNAMAKVIIQKRLEKIKKYSPTYIKEQLEGYPQLSHILYTTDDRIVIDKNSAKTVIGILCGTINLDLITKELNGIDENE